MGLWTGFARKGLFMPDGDPLSSLVPLIRGFTVCVCVCVNQIYNCIILAVMKVKQNAVQLQCHFK
jgi:hypothetical protein